MKKHILILSVSVIGILTGCSMIGMKGDNPLIGKWTAVHQSGAEIIFKFKPDKTMTCTVPEASDYSFTANYMLGTSKNATTLDMRDIESVNIHGVCLAIVRIVRINGNNKMTFFGTFGDPQQISRPAEFNKYTEFPDVYLEFKKLANEKN